MYYSDKRILNIANYRFTVDRTNIAEKASIIGNVADMLRRPFKTY